MEHGKTTGIFCGLTVFWGRADGAIGSPELEQILKPSPWLGGEALKMTFGGASPETIGARSALRVLLVTGSEERRSNGKATAALLALL